MKTILSKNNYFIPLSFFIIAIHQIIYQPLLGPIQTHFADYNYYMHQWIIGSIWFKKNLFSVPWFTPSYCMSFPFYANPQNQFYSISQLWFNFFDPVVALRLNFLFLSLVAFFGSFLLLRKVFKLDLMICVFGAMLFLFNGFFNERALVSHYGAVLFVYVPLYCYCLCESSKYSFKHTTGLSFLFASSLVLAHLIYGGAAALAPHMFLAIGLILIIVLIYDFNINIIRSLFVSFSVFLILSLSKIYSSFKLLSHFPRTSHLSSLTNDSFIVIVKNMVAGLFFSPLTSNAEHVGKTIENYDPFFDMFSSDYTHELNYTVTIAPILIFCLYGAIHFKDINFKKIIHHHVYLKIFLGLGLIFPIFINHDWSLFSFLREMPIINKLWVNARFFLIYIIPIILFSCFALNKIRLKNKNVMVVCLSIIALAQIFIQPTTGNKKLLDQSFFYSDNAFLNKIYHPDYNINKVLLFYDKTANNKKNNDQAMNKNQVVFNQRADYLSMALNIQLFNNSSLYDCYEPILGYRHELRPLTRIFLDKNLKQENKDNIVYPIDPYWNKDGVYNFNNPICELFPNENGCKGLGDNIRVSEKNKLDHLLNFKPIQFKKNWIQIVFDYLALMTFLMICIFYFVIIFKKFNRK